MLLWLATTIESFPPNELVKSPREASASANASEGGASSSSLAAMLEDRAEGSGGLPTLDARRKLEDRASLVSRAGVPKADPSRAKDPAYMLLRFVEPRSPLDPKMFSGPVRRVGAPSGDEKKLELNPCVGELGPASNDVRRPPSLLERDGVAEVCADALVGGVDSGSLGGEDGVSVAARLAEGE